MQIITKLFQKISQIIQSKGKSKKVGEEIQELKKFDLMKELQTMVSGIGEYFIHKIVQRFVGFFSNMIQGFEESTGIAMIKNLISKIKSLISMIKNIASSFKHVLTMLKGLGIGIAAILCIFFIFSIFNAISNLFSFSYGFDKTQYYDNELFAAVKNKELMEENLYEKASETSYYQRFVDAGIKDFSRAMLPDFLAVDENNSMASSKDNEEMAQKLYTGFYTMDSRLTIHDANFGSLKDYIQANTVDTDLEMSSYAQGYLRDYFNKEVNFTLSDQFLVELNNKAFAQNGQFGEDLQLIYPETFTKPIAFVYDYNRMEIVETDKDVFEWQEYTYITQRINNEDIGKRMGDILVNFNELNWAVYWGYSGNEISPDYVIQSEDEGKICSYPSPYIWEYIVSDKDNYEYIDLNTNSEGGFTGSASINTVDNKYNSDYLVLYNENTKTYDVMKFYYKLKPREVGDKIDCGLGDSEQVYEFAGPYLALDVNDFGNYENCLSSPLIRSKDEKDGFYYYTINIPNGYRLPEDVLYSTENGIETLVPRTTHKTTVRADFNEGPKKHLQTAKLLGSNNEVVVPSQNLINYKYYKFKTITESYRNQQEYIDGWANFLLDDDNTKFFTEMADRNFLDALGARLSAAGTKISDVFSGKNSNANMEVSDADEKNQKTIDLIASYPSEVLDLSVYLYENGLKNDSSNLVSSTNAEGTTTQEISHSGENSLWKYDYSVNAYFKTDNEKIDAQEYYQKFFYVAEELELAFSACNKPHFESNSECSIYNHSKTPWGTDNKEGYIKFKEDSVIFNQVYNLVELSQENGKYLNGKEFDGDTIGNEDNGLYVEATNNILTDLYEKMVLSGEVDTTEHKGWSNNDAMNSTLNYLTNKMTTKYFNLGAVIEDGECLGDSKRIGEYSLTSTLKQDEELRKDVLLFSGTNEKSFNDAKDPSGYATMTFKMSDWTTTLGDNVLNIFINAYNYWFEDNVNSIDSSKEFSISVDSDEHSHLQYDYYFVPDYPFNENEIYNTISDNSGADLTIKSYTSNTYTEYDYRLSKHGLKKLDTTNDLPMELKSVRDYGLGSVLNYVDSVVVKFKSGVYFDETYLGDEITKEILSSYKDVYRNVTFGDLSNMSYNGNVNHNNKEQFLYDMVYEGYYPKEYMAAGNDRLTELFTQNNKKQLLINLAENVDDKITEMSKAYDELDASKKLTIHVKGTGDTLNTYVDKTLYFNRNYSSAGDIHIDDISDLVIPTKASKIDSHELEDQLVVFPYLVDNGELAGDGAILGGFEIHFNENDIENLAKNDIYVLGNEFGYYTPYISAKIDGNSISRISQLLFPKRYYRSWVSTEELSTADSEFLTKLMKTVMLNSGFFQTTVLMPDKETALSSSCAANYGTIYEELAMLQDFNINNYAESTKYDENNKINNNDDYVYYLCTQYSKNADNFKGAKYSNYELVSENQLKRVFLIDEVVTFTGKFMYTYKDKLVALDTNSMTDITKGVIGTYATDRYVFLDSWDIKLLSDRIVDLSVMFFRTDACVRVNANDHSVINMTTTNEKAVDYITLAEYVACYTKESIQNEGFFEIIENFIEEYLFGKFTGINDLNTWGLGDSSNSVKMDSLSKVYAFFVPAKYLDNDLITIPLQRAFKMAQKDVNDANYNVPINTIDESLVLGELISYTKYICDGFMLTTEVGDTSLVRPSNDGGENWTELISDELEFVAAADYNETRAISNTQNVDDLSLSSRTNLGLQYINWWRKMLIEKGNISIGTLYPEGYSIEKTENKDGTIEYKGSSTVNVSIKDFFANELNGENNFFSSYLLQGNSYDGLVPWKFTTTLSESTTINSLNSYIGDGNGTLDMAAKGYNYVWEQLDETETFKKYFTIDENEKVTSVNVNDLISEIKRILENNGFYNFNTSFIDSPSITSTLDSQLNTFIQGTLEKEPDILPNKLASYISLAIMDMLDTHIMGGLFTGQTRLTGTYKTPKVTTYLSSYASIGDGAEDILGTQNIYAYTNNRKNLSVLKIFNKMMEGTTDFSYGEGENTKVLYFSQDNYDKDINEVLFEENPSESNLVTLNCNNIFLVANKSLKDFLGDFNGKLEGNENLFIDSNSFTKLKDDSLWAINTDDATINVFLTLNRWRHDNLDPKKGYVEYYTYGPFNYEKKQDSFTQKMNRYIEESLDKIREAVVSFFDRVIDKITIDSSYWVQCLSIIDEKDWSNINWKDLYDSSTKATTGVNAAKEMSGIFNHFIQVLDVRANGNGSWHENIPFKFTTYRSRVDASLNHGAETHVGCLKIECVVYTYTLKLADELALDIDYGRFYSQASSIARLDWSNETMEQNAWTDDISMRNTNLNSYENTGTGIVLSNTDAKNYDAGELYTITAKDIIDNTFLSAYNERTGANISSADWENIWAPELKIYDNINNNFYNGDDMKEYLYGTYLTNSSDKLSSSKKFEDFVVLDNGKYKFINDLEVAYHNPFEDNSLRTNYLMFKDFRNDKEKANEKFNKSSLELYLEAFFVDEYNDNYNYDFFNILFNSNGSPITNDDSTNTLNGYTIQEKIYNYEDFNSLWPVYGYGTEDRSFNVIKEQSDKEIAAEISNPTEEVENFETRFLRYAGVEFNQTEFTLLLNDLYNEKLYQAIKGSLNSNLQATIEQYRNDFNITGFVLVPRIADRRDEPTVYPLYRYFMGCSKEILPQETNAFFEGQTYDSWMDRMTITEGSTSEDIEFYEKEKMKLSEYLYSYLANFECYVPYNVVSDSDLEIRGTAGYGDLMTNYTLYPQYTNKYTQYFVNEASKEYWQSTLEKYDLSVIDLAQLLQGIAEVQLENSGKEALNILIKTAKATKAGETVDNRVIISNNTESGANDTTILIPEYSEENIRILKEAILNTINSSGGNSLTVKLKTEDGSYHEYFLPIVGIAALDDMFEEDKEVENITISTTNTFEDFVFIGTFSSSFKNTINNLDGSKNITWKTYNYDETCENIYKDLIGNVPLSDTGIVLMVGAGDALGTNMDTNYARQIVATLANHNPKTKIYVLMYPGFEDTETLKKANSNIYTFNRRFKNIIESSDFENISFISLEDTYCEQGNLAEGFVTNGLNSTYLPSSSGTVFINQDDTFKNIIVDFIFGNSFGGNFDYDNGNIKSTKDLKPVSVGSISYYDVDLEITKNNKDTRLDVAKSVQYLGVRLYKYVTKSGNFMKGLYAYFYGRDYINALSKVTADTLDNLVKYPNHGLFYNPTEEDISNAIILSFEGNPDLIKSITEEKNIDENDDSFNEEVKAKANTEGNEVISDISERGETLREALGVQRLKDCFSFIQNADSKKALSTNAVSKKYSVSYSIDGQLPAIDVDNPCASTQIVEIPIEAGQEKSFTYLKGCPYGANAKVQDEDLIEDWTDWALDTDLKTATKIYEGGSRTKNLNKSGHKGSELVNLAVANGWCDEGRYYIEEDGVKYYLVALASSFMAQPNTSESLGGKFVITTDKGNSWYAMQVDVKADRHTDTSNAFTAVAYYADAYENSNVTRNDDHCISRLEYTKEKGLEKIPVCVCEFEISDALYNPEDERFDGNIISVVPVQLADGSASGTYGGSGNSRNYAEEIWEEDYMKYQNTGLLEYTNHITDNDIEDLINTTAIYRTGNENVSTYDYTLLDFFLNRPEADIEDLDFNGNIRTSLLKVAMRYLGSEYSQGIVANEGWSRYIAPNGIIYSRKNYHLTSLKNDKLHTYAYVTAKDVAKGLETGIEPKETKVPSSEASRYAFDCSSFANYVYSLMGYNISDGNCANMIKYFDDNYPGNKVNYRSREDLLPGDIILNDEHVVIYMGEYLIDLDAQFDEEDLLVESGNDIWYTGQQVLDWANANAAGKICYIHCGGSGLEGNHSCVNVRPMSDTYLTAKNCSVYRIFWDDYSSESFNKATLESENKLLPSKFTSMTIENNPYLAIYIENSFSENEIQNMLNRGDFTRQDLDRAKLKINSVEYDFQKK